MANEEIKMDFIEFFSEIRENFSKKQEYERAFDEMMKVKDNPIQKFLEGKKWN